MTPKEVKRDLRAISKKAQSVATMLQAIDRHRKCSDVMDTSQSENGLEIITSALENSVEGLINLELKYIGLIERLEPTQRAVLIDHYINAEPLWKTANRFGYADRHLCRYLNEAILNIAIMTGYESAG